MLPVVGGIDWCKEQKDNENISKDMEKAKKKFAGHEIRGKKLGVIGLGAIGAEVANAAAALGMEVYGYDPFISVKAAWMLSRDVKHITSVDTIYQECDYITVHVPLLDSTRQMINKDSLGQMKDGVVILNFARDLLVNDDDMAEALASGRVKRYITDFPNAKVMQMPNVIATPHLGASTEESEDNCAVMAVKELMDYLDNGNIKNSVNFPNCDMGVCTTVGRLALLHKNVPNMIGQISSILASTDMNIANMTNKSRDKYAYTLVDLEDQGRGDEEINMVTIQGTIGASAQVGRTEGMDNKLKEHSNWKMLDRQSGEFTQAKGQEVMESFLKSYDDIDVVICENDNEAFGAIDAIKAAGKTCGPDGDIIVVSFDSVKAAFESMIAGDLNATFECNPLHGPRVAEIIQKLEKGEEVEKIQYVDEAYFDTSMDLEEILKTRAY